MCQSVRAPAIFTISLKYFAKSFEAILCVCQVDSIPLQEQLFHFGSLQSLTKLIPLAETRDCFGGIPRCGNGRKAIKSERSNIIMREIQLTCLIAVLCISGLKAGAQDSSFLTNGLLAYYPLAGNANDASGNGNNGTVNGATLTQDRFGRFGMAYEFNGSNSYISANVPNLPTGAAPRTASLWAKAQFPPTGDTLFWSGTAQNRQAFGLIINSSPLTWQGQSWGGGDDVNSGVPVDANWHHVVATYDGSKLSIFIDGNATGALSIGIYTPLSPVLIGAAFDSSIAGTTSANSGFFKGSIGDVRIFNRALSPQEIAQLYKVEAFISGIVLTPSVTITTSGNTGQAYSLQYCIDLTGSNWSVLATNLIPQGNLLVFPDTNAVSQPKRYYRVIAQ